MPGLGRVIESRIFFYDTKDIVSVINEYDAIFKNRIAEGGLMGVFPFGRNDEGAI